MPPRGSPSGAGVKDLQNPPGAARFSPAHAQLVLRRRRDGALFRFAFEGIGQRLPRLFFTNQLEINPQNLRAYAEKFAAAHKVPFPFVIDPQGKFAAEVNADRDKGKEIKLEHTPTVFVVSSRNSQRPYVEMKDSSQLYTLIDAMMKE